MSKKKKGVFTFVVNVSGKDLVRWGTKVDDSGNKILKNRIYTIEENRAYSKCYLKKN
jgi:hypothetical protein